MRPEIVHLVSVRKQDVPDEQGVFHQTAAFEVADQSVGGLIDELGRRGHTPTQITVVVTSQKTT